MTKADAARLVAIVVTAYPNYDKFRDADAVKATVGLWATMFADDDGRLVGLAVQKHIATNKWPPSVAEIREIMLELNAPDLIPPDRAWLAVSDALYAGSEYGGEYEIAKLPPLIGRAVEAIGWGNLWGMHASYVRGGKPGLDRVAFMQQYEPMYEREKQRAMTPAAIAGQIDQVAAAISDGGVKQLAALEAGRREREESYRMMSAFQLRALGTSEERLALEACGEE